MLASPDIALAERQPELPGMSLVLDVEALATAASRHGVEVPENCVATYVRFKPGTRCLVGYGAPEFRGPPLYYASAFQRESGKLLKAPKRKVVHSDRGRGRIVIDDAAVELCLFPNDDHLQSLIPLNDPEMRREVVAQLISSHHDEGLSELEPVAYKPERRCVFRYAPETGPVTLIKAYEENGYATALKRAQHFGSGRGTVTTQSLVGLDDDRRLLATRWLEGKSLAEEIRLANPDFCYLNRAGKLLARLHDSERDSLPEWDAASAHHHMMEVAKVLTVLLPEESARARQLASRVSAAVAADEPAPVVLHGDFHPRQVIDDGEKAALIDFDESLVGPAAVDLGRFISELHMNVARGEISEVAAESAADALVEGYSGTRAAPSASSIRNFTALALLNLAHEPFRRHRREWPTEISAILDSVERLLEAGA